jgi:molybdopterin/thiamine biosynthesis adenylyltransferase
MKSGLSDSELETYARQIVLKDIGCDGQLRLRNSTACVLGLGGLGSKIALQLVGMGIGHLRIVDRDIVSRVDLHRQYLYDTESIGRPKVEVAFKKLKLLNPDTELIVFPESLNSTNAAEIIAGADIVLDGLDRPESRYLVNRTCFKYGVPYVFGAAIQAYGSVSTIVPGQTFCLECFRPGRRNDDSLKAAVVGVDPSVLGIVTSVQVSEAVRLLTHRQPNLLNKLMHIDLSDLSFQIITGSRQEKCSVCGTDPMDLPEPFSERYIEETRAKDGSKSFVISPKRRIEIDLDKLKKILKETGFRITDVGVFGTTAERSADVKICILKTGTMVAQATPLARGSTRDDLLAIYKSVLVAGFNLPEDIIPKA